jgi:spore coat polysaccharide biosynthesis protein SpsF
LKTGFLITARLKSTRLPLKLLQPVENRPIFSHMLDRLKLAKRVDQIIVCTSTNPQDDPLIELAEAEGVESFRGEEDVGV